MNYDIILAGVGGQGVLSIATIIAKAAMKDGLTVRQSEVHGMSQRGGGVQAHLRISDTQISSDLIPTGGADMILAMEPMESLRYVQFLKKDGALVTASEPFLNIPNYPDTSTIYSTIKKIHHHKLVQAADLAKQAGHVRAVNMVLIGAALDKLPVSKESIEASISETFARKGQAAVDTNMKALDLGSKAP